MAYKGTTVSIVAAMSQTRAIGAMGRLPWNLPRDLIRFRKITMGKPIVMGRRTHESIARVLPGRTNLVVTSSTLRTKGAIACASVETALERAGKPREIMLIGGEKVYVGGLRWTDKIYLTIVEEMIEGDRHFPWLDPNDWTEIKRERCETDKDNAHAMTFIEMTRNAKHQTSEKGRGNDSDNQDDCV